MYECGDNLENKIISSALATKTKQTKKNPHKYVLKNVEQI